MAWAPPRNKSEWPSWEVATTVVESERRLKPEGGAEVPEIIFVSDAVEGAFVDLGGESRHEQVEAKLLRRGREMLNEGEEIRSPKRKLIRVESEETQDCVREEKSMEFGGRGREDVHTERGERSAESPCFAVTSNAAKRPSASGSWRR